MGTELYACIYAAEFPAQALLRLQPDMRREPVAVLDGRPPMETVCSINSFAHRHGADLHMTRLEAEAIAGLHLLHRSIEVEASARAVLIECAANFSPRIEDVSVGTACGCVLDIAGTEKLFGEPAVLAQRIRTAFLAAGFRASVAVSSNFHAARIKAASMRGIAAIPVGEEASALASLPVQILDLPEEPAETLAIWGIRMLGQLAELPEVELIARMGQGGRVWRELARGVHPHTLKPVEPEFQLTEFCEFEYPLEESEPLLFIGARMIDCLVSRAAGRAMALASIVADMKLDGGRTHRCTIRPALPSIDRKFLLKLLQIELAAHPPQAAVTMLTLSAEAGQSSKVQLGLFVPPTPEPSRLHVTIARLKAIVGEDRVGSPVLDDAHQPDSFHMERLTAGGKGHSLQPKGPRLSLRRMRPPAPVQVTMRAGRPASFRDAKDRYVVMAAYGPWRTSGCWWALDGWSAEGWDVQAVSGDGEVVTCLMACDRALSQWRLEAFYD